MKFTSVFLFFLFCSSTLIWAKEKKVPTLPTPPQEQKIESTASQSKSVRPIKMGSVGIGVYGHRADVVKSIKLERNTEAELGLGGGVLFDYPLSYHFSLEADVLYLQRQYKRLNVLDVISERQSILQIPFLLKFWAWNFITLGVGPYASYALGDVTQKSASGTQKISHERAGLKRFEYGVLGAGGFNVNITQKIRLLAETRYLLGLSDVSKIQDEERKFRELQFLVGFMYKFENFLGL